MQLDTTQKRIIQSKFLGHILVRGVTASGKTTIAVNRSIFLKNNYCLYEADKILIIAKDDKHLNHIKKINDNVEKETQLEYITLFSNGTDKVHFATIGSIENNYFLEQERSHRVKHKHIKDIHNQINIMKECIAEIKKNYKNLKILENKYVKFFVEEINWIKDCNYTKLEVYQNVNRIGRKIKKEEGPQRLLKNSKAREAIFKLLMLYNKKLKQQKLIDARDVTLLALKQANNGNNEKYTHIIVDDSENLTKLQLEFIEALCNNKSYSSLMLIADRDRQLNSNGWIIKGRKTSKLELGGKVKSYSLKKKYIDTTKNENFVIEIEGCEVTPANEGTNDMQDNSKSLFSIENFKYRDIRHNRKYEFIRDLGSSSEVIVKNEDGDDEYANDELRVLPVYSDIAAGEPILINPNIEDSFSLPKYWLKGLNDCFILKVKGDSMIGAGIYDGDYVVIRKQYTAQNNDIVAVDLDGSATLKRLLIKRGRIVLMPENEKYDPIPIVDNNASIIGVAIGVINQVN
jgi:SOS regulatory protein LexA